MAARRTAWPIFLALGACAHARPAPRILAFAPVTIVGGDKTDLLLASMNDEELFAKGTSAYAAGDFHLAAKAFDRLCEEFPKSSHFAAATYNAGLAHEQLAEWEAALERYRPLLDLARGTQDQIDAAFRAAECDYHLDRYQDAIAILQAVRARSDLDLNDGLEAQVQIGICQVEAGQLQAGETTLRDAVYRYEHDDLKERLDDYYPAQAEFYLGEIYRLYFEQIVLDPNKGGTGPLAKDLEYKAELLLSAQGHYLRAMRMGDPTWATAAGARVGGLYEEMYDAMTQAPVPSDLDAEEAEVYREELRKRVRVLVTKAISIYERTLEAAERMGTQGAFIDQARANLERMKNVLLTDAARDEAASQPHPPPAPAASGTQAPANDSFRSGLDPRGQAEGAPAARETLSAR